MDQLVLNAEVQGFELINEGAVMCFPIHDEMAKKFFSERPNKKNRIKF